MADQKQPQKQETQSSEQFMKQDTKKEISEKVQELRKHIEEQLEGDDIDPMLIERTNQIFNDTMAAIPPDPQEPKFQRATILTTMTKLRQQMEGALQSVGAKEEVTNRFKAPLEQAEDQAKQEDEKKKVAQPAGPSQSPQNPAPSSDQEVGQPGTGQQPAQPTPSP